MDRIGVIFGGKSTEHEISLLSASSVIDAIDRSRHEVICIGITQEGKWKLFSGDTASIADGSWEKAAADLTIDSLPEIIDFALPILHGAHGEDGTIQGLFEMLNLPYAGCGVLGSAAGMDKVVAKMIFEASGIPTCAYVLVISADLKIDLEAQADRCEAKLTYPMFVKPANAGSSVGISKVRNREELKAGLIEAAKFDRRLIVEVGVNARELETGVIGNEYPEVAAVGEIVASSDFYDFDAKYSGSAGTRVVVPAENVSKELEDEIRRIAAETYKALDCAGFTRVDFFVDKETGKPYVNEVNTIPGFTRFSMFTTLWAAAGVPFTELIEKIIGYGYERHNAENNRQTVRG